jgi:hypothetical protein
VSPTFLDTRWHNTRGFCPVLATATLLKEVDHDLTVAIWSVTREASNNCSLGSFCKYRAGLQEILTTKRE